MKVKVQVDDYMPCEFEISETDAELLAENSLAEVLRAARDVAFRSTHGLAAETIDDLGAITHLATRCWCSVQQAAQRKMV